MELELEQTEKKEVLTGIESYCYNLFNEYSSSSYRQRKLKEINDGRKRYHGDIPKKTFPWEGCSNKTMGLEAIAVDNLEPRIKNQLIAEDEFIQVIPTGPEDVEKTQGVKNFLHWALHNNVDIEAVIKPFIHDLLLDGTKDVIPIWREEVKINKIRRTVPVFMRADGTEIPYESVMPYLQQFGPQFLQQFGIMPAGEKDTFEEKRESEFKVHLEMVNLNDCFFPDTGDDFEEQPYLRRIWPTLRELKSLSGENGPYKNLEQITSTDGRQTADYMDEDAERKEVRYSDYSQEVQVLECYVKWDGEWTIVSFAVDAGFKEIRRQPMSEVYWHGRKPVRRFRIFPESNESMGVGIPTKIMHYSTGVDDLFNSMVDSATIKTLPFFFYNQGDFPGYESLDMTLIPGKGIPVPKGASVTIPRFDQAQQQFITFIELLLSFFERMLCLSDYTLGRESNTAAKGGETYSGMALIVQEGNIKHQYQGSALRDQFNGLIKDIHSLYAQYLPLDAKKRVFEDDKWVFEPLDALSIQGNYDFRVQVSDASANKMLNRKEKVELTQLMGGNPIINLHKLTQDVLQSYGKKKPDEYIEPNMLTVIQAMQQAPELPQVIQQYMQNKMAQQRRQEIAGEAQSNIERQEIERQVEGQQGGPLEDRKLLDQVVESTKRKMIQPAIETMMMGRTSNANQS